MDYNSTVGKRYPAKLKDFRSSLLSTYAPLFLSLAIAAALSSTQHLIMMPEITTKKYHE
jgi:hypothetical protein